MSSSTPELPAIKFVRPEFTGPIDPALGMENAEKANQAVDAERALRDKIVKLDACDLSILAFPQVVGEAVTQRKAELNKRRAITAVFFQYYSTGAAYHLNGYDADSWPQDDR
jgi:hypothetical protein